MFPLSLLQLTEIVAALEVWQPQESVVIKALSKDTRSLKAGDLYLAIKGEHFDGHQFVAEAQNAGASAALVQEINKGCSLAQIKVADTLAALGALAAYNREQFAGPVVAITGSAGKTTTKQLTQAVLSQKFNTLMTQGNLNNHIGAPLTLLAIEAQYQAAVIELGASGEGEIAHTAQWVKPQVAIITNASAAHLEGFGSLETVVRTKGELLDYIQPNGVAILNADDDHQGQWLTRALQQGVNVLLFGLAEHADVRAVNIETSLTGSRFELLYRGLHRQVSLPLLGVHNVVNALASAAAGLALGLSLEQVVSGLEQAENADGRLQQVKGSKGQHILNDAYNANPASVMAAIDVLSQASNSWLVLGDMAELGEEALAAHQQVGAYAKAHNIQHLLATGKLSAQAVASFGEQGQWFASKEQLAEYLLEHTGAADVVLVKGSRSAGMESIIDVLQQPQKIKEH